VASMGQCVGITCFFLQYEDQPCTLCLISLTLLLISACTALSFPVFPLNNYFPCKSSMYIYLRPFLVILAKKILAKANSMQKPHLPMRSVCKIQTTAL
jgi:hypothetical protein